MQRWKTLSRRTVLDSGKFLKVESHTVELPDGQIIPDWPWVVTPDYVIVVVVTEAGEFLCFRQTKYAIAGMSLALVGGYLEPGEEPLAAAQRELREETGYEAPDWIPLGRYVVNGNRGCGVANLFLARRAHWATPTNADDLEEQQLLRLNRAEVEEALMDGEFKGLAWAAALVLALFWLERRQSEK
ncbi:MAG: NUDIX hydrolase [Anaerolineae bacterium]